VKVTGSRREFCDDIIQREEALVPSGSGGAYHSTFNNTYGQSKGEEEVDNPEEEAVRE
jgi:hypothetical protein